MSTYSAPEEVDALAHPIHARPTRRQLLWALFFGRRPPPLHVSLEASATFAGVAGSVDDEDSDGEDSDGEPDKDPTFVDLKKEKGKKVRCLVSFVVSSVCFVVSLFVSVCFPFVAVD